VFVEKPPCLSVSEGRKLVDLASAGRRTLMMAHRLWYRPAILKLKGLVDDGRLGRMQYMYSNRLLPGEKRSTPNTESDEECSTNACS